MTAVLSESQVESYAEWGCLFPLQAMTPEEAAGYRSTLEAFEAEYGDRASDVLRSKSHLALTWVDELIRHPAILDVVEGILGPDIVCWGSSFFIKNPYDPRYIAWHQDAPFANIPDGGELLTAWIALAPSKVANGCLNVVPGTQTERVEHAYTGDASNMLSQGQEIAVEVDEADAVAIELEPGQFSLHHQFIFHGSGPSKSDERRIGLAVRYMKPFPRSEDATAEPAMIVRGEDRYGAFEPEPRPKADMAPEAVQYLENQLRNRHGQRYRKD